MKTLMVILLALLTLIGCTDAGFKQITTIGSPAEITCYSGGTKILEDKSTGKILTEEGSDGWYYQSAVTGKLVRASGTCIILN
jgi:hypothetical protein